MRDSLVVEVVPHRIRRAALACWPDAVEMNGATSEVTELLDVCSVTQQQGKVVVDGRLLVLASVVRREPPAVNSIDEVSDGEDLQGVDDDAPALGIEQRGRGAFRRDNPSIEDESNLPLPCRAPLDSGVVFLRSRRRSRRRRARAFAVAFARARAMARARAIAIGVARALRLSVATASPLICQCLPLFTRQVPVKKVVNLERVGVDSLEKFEVHEHRQDAFPLGGLAR